MPALLTTLWRQLTIDPVRARARLTTPSLVWEAPPRDLSDSGSWQMTKSGGALNRPTPGEALIFPVEKAVQAVNPFPMGVTIGRIETNDIILDDASVSRFHAWLHFDERGNVWSLTDAESRNGSWVNGVRCEPGKRLVVADGAEVRVGEARVRFMLPETLIAFVKLRAGEPVASH